jgi:hypothetical protein
MGQEGDHARPVLRRHAGPDLERSDARTDGTVKHCHSSISSGERGGTLVPRSDATEGSEAMRRGLTREWAVARLPRPCPEPDPDLAQSLDG